MKKVIEMVNHVPTKSESGFKIWITPEEHSLKYITFALLSLSKDELFEYIAVEKESVFILLSGKVKFRKTGFEVVLGPRRTVFHSRASALWLPPDMEANITSVNGTALLAVCQSPMQGKNSLKPFTVLPDQVVVNKRGKANWTREVHDIIDQRCPSKSLIIGETFNPPGNWSSYPPHKHNEENYPEETLQEEVYFYKMDPAYGFGLQRLYSDDGDLDEAYVLKDGDIVVINRGYHPVVAAPGISLYYLWMLAGENRYLAPKDDPVFSWLHQFGKI